MQPEHQQLTLQVPRHSNQTQKSQTTEEPTCSPRQQQSRTSQLKMRLAKGLRDYSITRYRAVDHSLLKFRSQKTTLGKIGTQAARLTKFFPADIADNKDEFLLEFNLNMQRDRIAKHALSPEAMIYAKPDFGFNDGLIFDDSADEENVWNKFLDCFSLVPKYERVKNYVEFIHAKKMDRLKRTIPQEAIRKFAQQGKFGNSVEGQKSANLELLRQVELKNKSIQQKEEQPLLVEPTKEEQEVMGLKDEVKMLNVELDGQKAYMKRMQRRQNRMRTEFDHEEKGFNRYVVERPEALNSQERLNEQPSIESKPQNKKVQDNDVCEQSSTHQMQSSYPDFQLGVEEQAADMDRFGVLRLEMLAQLEILIKRMWAKKLRLKCLKGALAGYKLLLCNQLSMIDPQTHLAILDAKELQSVYELQENMQLKHQFKGFLHTKPHLSMSGRNSLAEEKPRWRNVAQTSPFASLCPKPAHTEVSPAVSKFRRPSPKSFHTVRVQKQTEMASWLISKAPIKMNVSTLLSQSTGYTQGLANITSAMMQADSSESRRYTVLSANPKSAIAQVHPLSSSRHFGEKPRTPIMNAKRLRLKRTFSPTNDPSARLSTAACPFTPQNL